MKLVFCSRVNNAGIWLREALASIYNIVDDIVLVDSSPFGTSTDDTEAILRDFPCKVNTLYHMAKDVEDLPVVKPTGEKTIYLIYDNWFRFDRRRDLVPGTPYSYDELTAQARPGTMAFHVAGQIGAEWVEHEDIDHILYESAWKIRRLAQRPLVARVKNQNRGLIVNSYRYHRLDPSGDIYHVGATQRINGGDDYSFLGLFKYYPGIALGGLEGFISTKNCTDPETRFFPQHTLRDIIIYHVGFVCPPHYTEEQRARWLYTKKHRTSRMRMDEREDYNDPEGRRHYEDALTQEALEAESKEWARANAKNPDIRGIPMEARGHDPTGTRGRTFCENVPIPNAVPLVLQMDPMKYIEEGYPKEEV